jgi:dihydrofolate reductase
MGRLIYTAICSLDGCYTDADGDFSWSVPSEEFLADLNAQMRGASTHLYGRRMYETMHVWETDPAVAAQSPRSAEFAEIWQAAEKVVYSSSLPSVRTERTRLERRFEAAGVEEIKRSTDADVYVGGPTLAADALRLGLVDVLNLVVCPAVIGTGLAVLPSDVRLTLRLTDERRYDNGMVSLTYDITR